MDILAHRGMWGAKEEQNRIPALKKSLLHGFGIETDIRDQNGRLVISHDIPNSDCLLLEEFFREYQSINRPLVLALNIKSDGLQKILKELLHQFNIQNYFVFDASIPDLLGYKKEKIAFFSRYSEYEKEVAFYGECTGIWLDCFLSDWTKDRILEFLMTGYKVCLVSPELHKRPYKSSWQLCWTLLSDIDSKFHKQLMICTDFPEEARSFFLDFVSSS